MEQSDCPFCGKDAAEAVFAENRHFRALYNIAPILPGHSLVVPKRHVESLMELTDKELCEYMVFGRAIAKVLSSAFGTDAFNWTIQEKEVAGQTVPHLHMHIIPRRKDDLPSPGDWFPRLKQSEAVIDSSERAKLTKEEMAEIVSRLRRFSATVS